MASTTYGTLFSDIEARFKTIQTQRQTIEERKRSGLKSIEHLKRIHPKSSIRFWGERQKKIKGIKSELETLSGLESKVGISEKELKAQEKSLKEKKSAGWKLRKKGEGYQFFKPAPKVSAGARGRGSGDFSVRVKWKTKTGEVRTFQGKASGLGRAKSQIDERGGQVLEVESLGGGRQHRTPEMQETTGGGFKLYEYKPEEVTTTAISEVKDTDVQEVDVTTGKKYDLPILDVTKGKGVTVFTDTGSKSKITAPTFQPFITSGSKVQDMREYKKTLDTRPKDTWTWGDPSPYLEQHGYDPKDADFLTEISKTTGNIKLTETAISNVEKSLPIVTKNIEDIESQLADIEESKQKEWKFQGVANIFNKEEATKYLQDKLKEQKKTLSSYKNTLPKLESSLSQMKETKFSLEDYQKKGYTLDVKEGKYEIALPKAVDVHKSVYAGKIGYTETSLATKIGMTIFPPLTLVESTKMLLAGQEGHGVQMAMTGLIDSPFGLQTLWDVGASGITGDIGIKERRTEATARKSLELTVNLKEGGLGSFTGKVLTSGAMVEGVYLPIASMGFGKAFQLVGKGTGALGTWVSGGKTTGLLGFSGKVISKAPSIYFGVTVPVLVGADIGYTEAMQKGAGISKAGHYLTTFAFMGAGARYGSRINLGFTKDIKMSIGTIKAKAGQFKTAVKSKVATGIEKTAFQLESKLKLPESSFYQKGIRTYGKLKGMTVKSKVITEPKGKMWVEKVGKEGLIYEKKTTGDKFKVDEVGYSYKQKQDLLIKGVEKPEIIRTEWKSKWGTKYGHVSYGAGKDVLLKKGAIVTRSFGTITQDVSTGFKKKFITTKFEKLSLGGDVKSLTIRTDFGKATLSSSDMVKFKHFIGSVTTGKGVQFSKGWSAIKDVGVGKAEFKFEPRRISKKVVYGIQEYKGKLTKAPEIIYGRKSYLPSKTGTIKLKAHRFKYLTVSGKYAETGDIIVKGTGKDVGISTGDLKYRLKTISTTTVQPTTKIDFKPLSSKQITPVIPVLKATGKETTPTKTIGKKAPLRFAVTSGKSITFQELESMEAGIVEPYRLTKQQKATKERTATSTLLILDTKPVLETVDEQLPLIITSSKLDMGTLTRQKQEDYVIQTPYNIQDAKQSQEQKQAMKQKLGLKQSYKSIFETPTLTTMDIDLIDPPKQIPPPIIWGGKDVKPKKKVKMGRPRKRAYRLPKKRIALKTILADPFSVQTSQVKYGKATTPKVTKKVWEEFKRTGKVKTVEMRQAEKQAKKDKIDFDYITKGGGAKSKDKVTFDFNILGKKKKKKKGGKK